MRKIDLFTHIMPPEYFSRLMSVAPGFADVGKRMRSVPMLVDLDLRFRVMDRFEGYQQVLSLPTPPIEAMAAGQEAIDLARAANDGMAMRSMTPPNSRITTAITAAAKNAACRVFAPAVAISELADIDPPTGVPWKTPATTFAAFAQSGSTFPFPSGWTRFESPIRNVLLYGSTQK